MDPFTLAAITFGVQKLRGKSTNRALRDGIFAGGLGQLGGMAGVKGFSSFGSAGGMGGAGALAGEGIKGQFANTGVMQGIGSLFSGGGTGTVAANSPFATAGILLCQGQEEQQVEEVFFLDLCQHLKQLNLV
tara:strand:- start:1199 stop:1594 length:396 start_codon:yes stop_codon:yes gene_type:complete